MCHGHQRITQKDKFKLAIKPGSMSGDTIRVPRGGDQHPDADPGDLVVHLLVSDHPVFARKGDDLHTELVVSLTEALLGFTRSITHLDKHDVPVVRSGVTQHGTVHTLCGKSLVVVTSVLTPRCVRQVRSYTSEEKACPANRMPQVGAGSCGAAPVPHHCGVADAPAAAAATDSSLVTCLCGFVCGFRAPSRQLRWRVCVARVRPHTACDLIRGIVGGVGSCGALASRARRERRGVDRWCDPVASWLHVTYGRLCWHQQEVRNALLRGVQLSSERTPVQHRASSRHGTLGCTRGMNLNLRNTTTNNTA